MRIAGAWEPAEILENAAIIKCTVNQVGRYKILNELGRGAAGIVYKALDPTIGRTIAIKSIRLGDADDSEEKREVRERLLREAQSAGGLSHPNIVTIYDIYESDDFAHILMEYVDGDSLQELLRSGQLPSHRELWQFLRQIAEALDYAHRKGIVHRDIKPANILISKQQPEANRFAKVADFGIARFVALDATQNGAMIGTPNYMSPEQIQGLAVTGASDQFALAVIVYELLCGERPFHAEALPSLFYQICKQNPRPVESVNPALSGTVGKVINRALAKDPAERFAACSDFIGALSIALSESPDWTRTRVRSPAETQSVAEVAAANVAAASIVTGPVPSDTVATATTVAVADRVAEPPVAPAPEEPPAVAAEPAPDVLFGWDRIAQRDALERESDGSRKRLILIVGLIAAVATAALFVIRWNSGSMTPVQILDTKSGSVSAPPEDAEQTTPEPAHAPADLASTPPAPAAAPTVSKPEDAPAPARKLPNPAPASKENPAAAPVQEKLFASLDLVSDPTGAKITVDSDPSKGCLAPCSLSLPVGRHTLQAQMEGYTTTRKIFNVPSSDGVFVSMTKNVGVLIVNSAPTGSNVAVDGTNRGQTPVTLTLTAGPHHLTLYEGSRRHDETIEIDTGGMHTRTLRW